MSVAPQSAIIVLLIALLFLISNIILRFAFLTFAGMYMLYQDKKALENRKKTLGDLILMKDIQTELEKEIEQATLKAAFQN